MVINRYRALCFKSREITVLEEHEHGLTLTPYTTPSELVLYRLSVTNAYYIKEDNPRVFYFLSSTQYE